MLGWKPGHQMEVYYKAVVQIFRILGMTDQSKMLGREHAHHPTYSTMIINEVEVIIGVLISSKSCIMECGGSQPTCLMTS